MDGERSFEAMIGGLTELDGWEDRYRFIIKLGHGIPRLADAEKSGDNRVHGCVSQVWLASVATVRDGQTHITFRGESDAMIVQGLMAILLAVYSGRPAGDIAETDAIALLDGFGLREHLTAQRSNGLVAMVNRMRAEGMKHST